MRYICALLVMFFAMGAQAEFIGETDIPLMDGMQINENESFSFDVPAGQITELTAVSKKSAKEIREFYQTTLEELGWQKKSATQYRRDQDELFLQIKPGKKETTVKIQYSFPNR